MATLFRLCLHTGAQSVKLNQQSFIEYKMVETPFTDSVETFTIFNWIGMTAIQIQDDGGQHLKLGNFIWLFLATASLVVIIYPVFVFAFAGTGLCLIICQV